MLTDIERGKLAYTYLTQGNELEQKRIASVMPQEHFVVLSDGYRRMFINLNNLTMLYAVAYWQQVSRCHALMAGAIAQIRDDEPEAYKPYGATLQRC